MYIYTVYIYIFIYTTHIYTHMICILCMIYIYIYQYIYIPYIYTHMLCVLCIYIYIHTICTRYIYIYTYTIYVLYILCIYYIVHFLAPKKCGRSVDVPSRLSGSVDTVDILSQWARTMGILALKDPWCPCESG